LARVLAYRLYLPHRVPQHTIPYLTIAGFGLLVGAAAWRLWPDRPNLRRRVAVAIILASTFLLGDGLRPAAWGNYRPYAKIIAWTKREAPLTATFAGDIDTMDFLPFFTARQAYVNWGLAHPFRKGYLAEVERRYLETFGALYATDGRVVADFGAREGIDYFVVDARHFEALPNARKLFQPLRRRVDAEFRAAKRAGTPFFLESPPPEAVVFRSGRTFVIDMAKLREALARSPAPAPAAEVTPAP
jgi:hypothetical protein